jgi:hypothetical protein
MNTRASVYRNAVVVTCTLGLLGLLVGCLEIGVSFDSTNPSTSLPLSSESSKLETAPIGDETGTATTVSSLVTAPTHQVELSNSKTTPILAYRQKSASNVKYQGTLRMSNQTDQPVRLALLARQSVGKGSAAEKTNYDIPAHWDFAPQEGSDKGLMLSLPNGNLKLEKGDILVAFAQDGSRRYWGPYVIGETPLPSWNSQKQEWILVLAP